jgi:hypothetical protein
MPGGLGALELQPGVHTRPKSPVGKLDIGKSSFGIAGAILPPQRLAAAVSGT